MYIIVDGEQIEISRSEFEQRGYLKQIEELIDDIVIPGWGRDYDAIVQDSEHLIKVLKALGEHEEFRKIASKDPETKAYYDDFISSSDSFELEIDMIKKDGYIRTDGPTGSCLDASQYYKGLDEACYDLYKSLYYLLKELDGRREEESALNANEVAMEK